MRRFGSTSGIGFLTVALLAGAESAQRASPRPAPSEHWVSTWGTSLLLAQRLSADPRTRHVAVVNQGISGNQVRQAVNVWIRTSGRFDAVVDFDAAVRDPERPARLKPTFDPGDHIHPNDAGNEAMAAAFDLGVFTKRRSR